MVVAGVGKGRQRISRTADALEPVQTQSEGVDSFGVISGKHDGDK